MQIDANSREQFDHQVASNTDRLQDFLDQQYNVDITRSIELHFSSLREECARALTKALFAKGTRVLTHDPEKDGDLFRIRVGVRRSLRDSVQDEFTRDMVNTAAAMHASYDGWDLLTDDAVEGAHEAVQLH